MKKEIRYVIQDVNMSLSFDGLKEIISHHKKKHTLFKKHMEAGGLILFVNNDRSRCKLFEENGNVIGYYKSPSGMLTEAAIDEIPEAFGGSLTKSEAVKRALKTLLKGSEKKDARLNKTLLYA